MFHHDHGILMALEIIIWITIFDVAVMSTTSSTSSSASSIKNDTSERTAAFMPGDFRIGVLFSVRHQPKQKKTGQNHFLACGEIRELYGIQRSEVTFKTIDEINNNPDLLPNITLGIEIRDSCWFAPVALQQSIELIRDSISPKMPNSDTCSPQDNNVAVRSYAKSNTENKYGSTLIGILGPGSSSVALQVQNLLQLFSIPQIGYSTTSKDLSDKGRYSTFMRVVPSDYYQAQVMIDLVRRFNWTYISAVNTDENYGQSGIQAFRELAEKFGVCIAREDSILSNADDESFSDVLRNLHQDGNANVVVCFCEGMTVRGLLGAMQRLNLTDRFLIIGSDGWADRADVVTDYERQALGSITIRIHSPYVESFDPYYFSLNPFTNKRNPWFKEFWEMRFGCKMPPDLDLDTDISDDIIEHEHICTGNEKLSDRYKQEPKLSFVIKAIYTMAYALQALQQDSCGRHYVGLCGAMYPFNGTLFLNYLMNVSFTYGPDGDIVEFDNRGDPPGRYDIMNYQLLEDGSTFDYVQVGEWNNGTLNFLRELQDFPTGKPVQSVCSKPCPPGFYKNLQTGGQEKRCCWVCVPCERHQYLYNETHCQECDNGYWPDALQSFCLQIPVEYVQWGDTEALVAICFALIGFAITGIVFGVFIQYNDTPVVKASTRELCYLILVGMILSHASIFAIIARPSVITCTISRTLPGISFSMIYASLLVKTNRIARILAGSKKRFPTRKPRFMSAGAQLIITSLLISIEVAVAITMLVMEAPEPELQFPTRPRAILSCNTTPKGVLFPLAFIFLLIILCTLYALKTRNVPENFNEAKFVGFAMYTTCVIWVAFVPIYFGSESKIITMCLCISLSAMVTLVFLFLPKLYIILIRPEKNIRALFTTSKTIRCHIGSRVASAISHKTSSSFSSGPGADDYERERDYHHLEHTKPIIRSSSCQTSLELLHVLMDLQKNYKTSPQLVHNTTTKIRPTIGWSELNVNELTNFANTEINQIDNNSINNYNIINNKHQLNPPKYEHINLPIKSATSTTATTTVTPSTITNINKIFDSNSTLNRIHFNETTIKVPEHNIKQKPKISILQVPNDNCSSNKIVSSLKPSSNNNHKKYISSNNCGNKIATGKNKYTSGRNQTIFQPTITTIEGIITPSKSIDSLQNNNYNYSSTQQIPEGKKNQNSNLCIQCAELENNKVKIFKQNHTQDKDNIINNVINEPINQYEYTPIFTIESPSLGKTTISEESLSECSLSESCDCKLKSITIRLASPNFKT